MCVLHSVERHCVCTAQFREALCVLHSVERHCVCTAQSHSASLHCSTHTHQGKIYCHNTNYVHINGQDRTITVILAKHCIELHDDGSLVIRNMLEQF